MTDSSDQAKTAAGPGIAVEDKARILSEALPFMQRYDRQTVVVKYGGHAMGDENVAKDFARDIVLLKQSGVNPIVVHGGGPQIGAMLARLNIKSEFADGLRITDKATVEVVEMVLAGSINKEIVTAINRAGGQAAGLCGKDGNLVVARKLTRTKRDPESNIERILDLGFVGEPARINPQILATILDSDIIPVIAPIGVSAEGETYNINADTVAGAIAGAMAAKRLLLLTDVAGVLDKDKRLIPELTVADALAMIGDGTISGGMIPKVETCLAAIQQGVEAVVILDGRVPHAVLLELYMEGGFGTLIRGSAAT
jgi:acetylglutamate kinase